MRKLWICILLILCSCTPSDNSPISSYNKLNHDTLEFKEEIESYNDTLLPIYIDETSKLQYISLEKANECIEKDSVILLFGDIQNNYTRRLLPFVLDIVNRSSIATLYYVDMRDKRDEYKLDDNGNLITIKETSPDYSKLLDLLKEYVPAYEGIFNKDIKRLYLPTLVIVKKGTIIYFHEGIDPSYTNPLEEIDEQIQIYLTETIQYHLLDLFTVEEEQ